MVIRMRKFEYRVVWRRKEGKEKVRRYAYLKSAERFLTLLGPEPWTAWGAEPDARHCYREACLCEQRTNIEYFNEIPPCEYARIEVRPLQMWEVHKALDFKFVKRRLRGK